MKLKKILENLEGLDAAISALYTKGADNKFHLELEGDDGDELRRAKDHEVGLRKIAEKERDAVKTELTAAQAKIAELTAAQSTDVQKLRTELTTDHERQMAAADAKHKKEVEGLNTAIKTSFVDAVANGIAKDIAVDEGAAEILGEILKKRLTVEIVNGEPLTRVLSAAGEATSLTPDQLKNEYFTNEKYASIMRASDASGGGAPGNKKGGGASGKKLDDMNDLERKEWLDRDPASFNAAVEANKNRPTK